MMIATPDGGGWKSSGKDENIRWDDPHLHSLFELAMMRWLEEVSRRAKIVNAGSPHAAYEFDPATMPTIEILDGHHIREFFAKIGSDGESIEWILTDAVRAISEVDALRLFTDDLTVLAAPTGQQVNGQPERSLAYIGGLLPKQLREQTIGDWLEHAAKLRQQGTSSRFIWFSLIHRAIVQVVLARAGLLLTEIIRRLVI